MPPLKVGRVSRNFGFLLPTLHLTSLAVTVGKLCFVHADASFFQSPNLSNTHIQLTTTTVYSQIINKSLRQKRIRCKIVLPQKNVVWFTRSISVLELWRWSDRNGGLVRWSEGLQSRINPTRSLARS